MVRTRKNKLCSTMSFGRTLRFPKALPTDSRFLLDKNFYSSCRTGAVMVEILLAPHELPEVLRSGDKHSQWLLSFRSRLTLS